MSKDSDEKKSREAHRYKAVIERAILLQEKGEDCRSVEKFLLNYLKLYRFPQKWKWRMMSYHCRHWGDSEDDNINMDHEGTYEELALMGGEEEDASSRAMVEEEEAASSQQEILTPTALRRAVVEQISI